MISTKEIGIPVAIQAFAKDLLTDLSFEERSLHTL